MIFAPAAPSNPRHQKLVRRIRASARHIAFDDRPATAISQKAPISGLNPREPLAPRLQLSSPRRQHLRLQRIVKRVGNLEHLLDVMHADASRALRQQKIRELRRLVARAQERRPPRRLRPRRRAARRTSPKPRRQSPPRLPAAARALRASGARARSPPAAKGSRAPRCAHPASNPRRAKPRGWPRS